jgi:hypothetical protein
VIIAAGAGDVASDPGAVGGDEGVRPVASGQADDGPGSPQEILRTGAELDRSREVVHAGVAPFSDPLTKAVEARRFLGSREPDAGETVRPGLLAKDAGRAQAIW